MRRVAAFVALLVLIGMFTACAEDDSLRLTFDGESCTYEGPTELPAGTAELVFVNEGEGVATAYLVSLFEGYTAEDLIDDIGQEPSEKYWRSWQKRNRGLFLAHWYRRAP